MVMSNRFKDTDIGKIPIDWDCKDITQISKEIFLGLTTKVDYVSRNGIPLVRASDIASGRLNFTNVRHISIKQHQSLTKYHKAEKGDVLVSKSGSLGTCAIVDTDKEFSIYESVIVVKPTSFLDSTFLLSLLRDGATQARIIGGKVGSGVAHINLGSFRSLKVGLPSSKREQKAIAEALSDADALIESLEKLIEKKKMIKQGVMQELLTGKRRLPGFSGEWKKTLLGEEAEFFKGRGLPKSEITPDGKQRCIHYGELFTYYPETIYEVRGRTNSNNSCFYSVENDVLMPTSDVTPRGLAKASCVKKSGIILGGDILVIRPKPKRLNGTFLSYLIRHFDSTILQLVTGSTVYHLYASDMKRFALDLPELKEQGKVVDLLEQMGKEIIVLENNLEKLQLIKSGMMQQLLTGRIRLV